MQMGRALLILIGLIIAIALAGSVYLTRDGRSVTPLGEGVIDVGNSEFENFPLPDYAAEAIGSEFKSYLIEVEPGIKIHVLEIGTGFPVYMQHGNPTSGWLYRKVAAELPSDQFRMIMPTMVGLGFSSKIPASEHTLDNHIRWMNSALNQLELGELVYVGQDWGGPVGMGALERSPELLQGVVAMNTGFTAPTEARALSSAHSLAKTPVLGEFVLEQLGIFHRLADAQGDPESMNAEVTMLYERPVVESGNRKAPLALMRMVADSPDHPSAVQMRDIEAYVRGLDVPAEIVWGMNDPILGSALPVMESLFPDAPVTRTEAGHFLQEEVPEEIAAAIVRVVSQVRADEEVELETERELTVSE
jgi:haloalkane dehalogenase